MYEEEIKQVIEIAENLGPVVAKLTKSYYDELIKQGFTTEQAFELTKNYKVK